MIKLTIGTAKLIGKATIELVKIIIRLHIKLAKAAPSIYRTVGKFTLQTIWLSAHVAAALIFPFSYAVYFALRVSYALISRSIKS